MSNRRYDIDWIRVIAIGLLLIYHTAIGFQPWGPMLGFITNTESWGSLWIPMTMLNVWRIPLLFFVSGMGVCFTIQNRNWKGLLKERTVRILVPFLFGTLAIVPISGFIAQYYHHLELRYEANPGHLWFLGNIFLYVVILLPLFVFLKRKQDSRTGRWIRKWLSSPLCLLLVLAFFMLEVWLVDPLVYELYAMTAHGFFLGLLAFFVGYCFMLGGDPFCKMLLKWKWLFLLTAVSLYSWRLFQVSVSDILLVTESLCWIFTVFAFGYRYLNKPGRVLTYLSQAAYPVYIMHMIFLFLGYMLIFRLKIPVQLKFFLVLLFTVAGCLGSYEFVIRRIKILRLLFGLRADTKKLISPTQLSESKLEVQPG